MRKETVADLLAALAERGGPDCEPVETLHEWVSGVLPESRSAEVESHVARCPRCAAEARLAGWYEENEESTDLDVVAAALASKGHPEPVSISSRWWARPSLAAPLALAATLLLVAGLSLFRQQPPPVGDLPAGDVVRGAAPSIVAPRGTLTAAPESVGWLGDDAYRYRVELLAVDGSVLWSADVAGERVALPAEVRAALTQRVTYRLRVVPLAPEGGAAGAGDEVEFRIVGDRP